VLSQAEKQQEVADLKEKFGRARCVFVADYRGLDVQAVDGLRKKLRAEGRGEFEYRVTKNTLLRRAAEGSDVAAIAHHFDGPTALAIGYGDPVRLAKLLVDFGKQHEVFALKGGVFEGRAMERAEIGTLATLPSLEELRGRLVGLLQAPAVKLARVLFAPGTQVARVVEARRKQLEEAGGTAQ
jgi:large subunit ribosomal protein L10